MELICHPHIHWNSTPLLASCIVLLSVSLYFYMICLRMVCELKLNVSVKFSCALHMQAAAPLGSLLWNLPAQVSDWKLLTSLWLLSTLSLSWWLESG